MKIFIAGICGTFMAGIAQLALESGHRVSGCDENVYPPMSDVLAAAGIKLIKGYNPDNIPEDTDCILIGNALSRGNPLIEYVLDQRLPYSSGPQWLSEQVLRQRKVIAVAGTHGKTTTASIAAWILESAGMEPGFLIGGQPGNFDASARLGRGDWFVIEADEYDTAFFDKRSKFVHYHPHIAVLNNIEFDHADIFANVDEIRKQFHHLVRIVPRSGTVIANRDDENVTKVLGMGLWSNRSEISITDAQSDWHASAATEDAQQISLMRRGKSMGKIHWRCIGRHNMQNAVAAIAAACDAGVTPARSIAALSDFQPGARRLERLFESDNIIVYNDFAHHPTAIESTLRAVRAAHRGSQIIAIIEPRSNTMRMGYHSATLGSAIAPADQILFYTPRPLTWNPIELGTKQHIHCFLEPSELVAAVGNMASEKTVVVAMSNGSFDGLPAQLVQALERSQAVGRADKTNQTA